MRVAQLHVAARMHEQPEQVAHIPNASSRRAMLSAQTESVQPAVQRGSRRTARCAPKKAVSAASLSAELPSAAASAMLLITLSQQWRRPPTGVPIRDEAKGDALAADVHVAEGEIILAPAVGGVGGEREKEIKMRWPFERHLRTLIFSCWLQKGAACGTSC